MTSCFYWLFRHVLGFAVLRCRADAANEVEILVLLLQEAKQPIGLVGFVM